MKKKTFLEFVKFLMVGFINTMVSYVTYSVLFFYGVPPLICNIPAFIISVFVAFILNSKFVFKGDETKQERTWWKALLKSYVTYSFSCLFLAEFLTFLWLDVVHIERFLGFAIEILESINIRLTIEKLAGYLVPFVNLVFCIPINFVLNKFWAYRQKDVKPETDD